ncbi:hypothetical protein U9R90_08600 [Streptomyces sp. E11-3]|uniref:hypothetical protein n=1 Tax=Streptomyces sp. E11-3 TaxID=3110112 RepID=UPI003981532C
MSDKKKPEPTLTPQEQAQQKDEAQINGQFAATDMLERANDLFEAIGFGPRGSVFGATAFDGRKLNEMLDFLESANPADLEHAGETLEKATTAINKAAKDLNDFVKQTDWSGEGATEFQRYGADVVSYAWRIGKMANAVGAQMKVASTGLTSVRNARPPRDGRLIQKRPDDFEIPERTDSNPDYQKALQVEKDRQETINQMNRLASFYAVSQQTLASQEAPRPPRAYGAAVPEPTGRIVNPVGNSDSGASREDLSQSSVARTEAGETGVGEMPPRTGALGKAEPVPASTSMEIDTVTTLPPTTPTATPPSPTTGTPPTNQGPVPPMSQNYAPPVSKATPRVGRAGDPRRSATSGTRPPMERSGKAGEAATRRAAGTPGKNGAPPGRAPSTANGRPVTGGRPPAMGTPTNNTTRPGVGGAKGQPPVVGRPTGTGQPTGGAKGQSPVVGRPTGTGQPAGGRNAGPTGTRGGRSDGIVGGRPQRVTGGTTGSRLPRGTVIGGESPGAGRPSPRQVGRGTPSTSGVVGTPRAPGTRAGTGARPTGGTAPVGGRGNQRQRGDENQDREGSTRPDYLTEDEETWTNRRRGPVPPVIE